MSENAQYLWKPKLSNRTIWKPETARSSDHDYVRRSVNFVSIHRENLSHKSNKTCWTLSYNTCSVQFFQIQRSTFALLFPVILSAALFFGHWNISTSAGFLNVCAGNYSTFFEVQEKKKKKLNFTESLVQPFKCSSLSHTNTFTANRKEKEKNNFP